MIAPFFRSLSYALCLTAGAQGVPLRVLAIGDSMTEEYAYELTFSAPASNSTNANVRSWPELFRLFRPTEVSLGPFEATGGSYLDLRNAGQEWNFGIPGMTLKNWGNLLADTPGSDPLRALYPETRDALEDEVWAVEAVVILLGANDLKQDYDQIFNNTEPANFFSSTITRLNNVYAWVNTSRGTARPKIVVCTVPDVGATPQISATYNTPAKKISTRAKIAAFNQSIITWAAGKTYPPSIARLDVLTDRIFDEVPFHLNGTLFTLSGSQENPPKQVFCRDGFHVSTVGQALIANEILKALKAATGRNLTLFSNREILQNLLGQNPDQPYLDWISAAGLAGSGMNLDPDHDGFPNLAEFLLGSPPGSFNRPIAGSFSPGKSLSFQPSATGLRFGTLAAEESQNLSLWTPVPAGRTSTAGNGTVSVTPAAGSKDFVRLNALPRP